MGFMPRLSFYVVGGLAAAALAGSVMAQSATIQADVTPNGPSQFRDGRTGTVGMPDAAGRDNRLSGTNKLEPSNQPPTPADRAFDPGSQVATAEPLVVQRPRANAMGTVPITAGPTVPVVTIDGPSLQAIPGDRWLTMLYVTNNSAAAVDPQIGCTFTNQGRAVQETRIVVPTTAAGTRLGVPAYGPRTDIFVDRVLCRVLAP